MNIGLVAHDSKKTLMQSFCVAYRGILNKHKLYATGSTGRSIEEVTNLPVHKFPPGILGGEQQLGFQIENKGIDMVIFLRDPERPKPQDPSMHNVLRLCDIHLVPLATNIAAAEMLIKSLERGELDWRDAYR